MERSGEGGNQIGKSTGRFGALLAKMRPDLLLVLGDRSDILPSAIAAATLGIPVAQLHGGDRSGAFLDNAYRGAIAAFTSLHLPASHKGARDLARRGIPVSAIRTVGAPGLDAIRNAPRISGREIRKQLGLPAASPYLLVLQHPPLGQASLAGRQMGGTLRAVCAAGLPALVIYPNADPGSREGIREIERVRGRPGFVIRRNLAHDFFVNALRHATALVGNSSSGIIEAPFLGTPVVNIGTRQDGRERGGRAIDVPQEGKEIARGIRRQARRPRTTIPYGDGRRRRGRWRQSNGF